MSSARIEVEKFDGRGDYSLWKEKLMAHLDLLGLLKAMKESALPDLMATKPKRTEDGDKLKEDEAEKQFNEKLELLEEKMYRARSTIVLCLTDRILRKVKKEPTAAGLLRALDTLFMSQALPNRIYLKQKLYGYKMADNISVEANIDEFMRLITDLENTNVSVSDEDQAILLLMSLPKQFDQLRDTLKYGPGKTTLTLDEVVAAIYSKELEFSSGKKLVKNQSEGLYVKENRGRTDKKEKGKGNRRRSKSKGRKACWICNEEGHFKNNCPSRGGQGSNKKGDYVAKGNLVEAAGLCVSEVLLSIGINLEDEWIMDTGCTYHMSHKKEWFEDLNTDVGGTVRMGNKSVSEVKGIGNVRIRNEDGLTVLLTQVRYIPSMDRNLLSLGTFEKSGYRFESENGILSVKIGDKTYLSGVRRETLYLLKFTPASGESLAVVKMKDDSMLWHQRLGHISQKSLTNLLNQGLLDKKKISKFPQCDDCIYGKATKVSFLLAHHGSKEKLEYVHSDLWGAPSVPLSLGRCQYFISFIDDFTHKVWVYFLKTKDEAFESFSEWLSLVENQSGKKLKTLRTDNGLEYCNKEFDSFCQTRGIERHRTCAYTPQQNGVAERMNRTIMERVRCMLSDSGLPKRFWAEATHTAVVLINKTPSSAIENEVPDKRWTGRNPVYNYLRRYGCVTFVHTSDDKLDPRAKKGVLIGYPSGKRVTKCGFLVKGSVLSQETRSFKRIKCTKICSLISLLFIMKRIFLRSSTGSLI